jgi:hypothetical protein
MHFNLDLTTGSITNAVKALLGDPCPGTALEVAIHKNESRSELWLLARWGRFQFVTVPAILPPDKDGVPVLTDLKQWLEMRDGEQTLYSGKKYLCSVFQVNILSREITRNNIHRAIVLLTDDLNKAMEDACNKVAAAPGKG